MVSWYKVEEIIDSVIYSKDNFAIIPDQKFAFHDDVLIQEFFNISFRHNNPQFVDVASN